MSNKKTNLPTTPTIIVSAFCIAKDGAVEELRMICDLDSNEDVLELHRKIAEFIENLANQNLANQKVH